MERDPEVIHNYASALLAATKKHGMPLDQAAAESAQLRDLVVSRPRFKLFIDSPQFREDQKRQVIDNAFKDNASELVYQFLLLLLRRNRLNYLIDILGDYEHLIEIEQGITEGEVTTAVELTDDEKNAMRHNLNVRFSKDFLLSWSVDPSILGGVRVQFGDTLIDSTVESHLRELRRRLARSRLAS